MGKLKVIAEEFKSKSSLGKLGVIADLVTLPGVVGVIALLSKILEAVSGGQFTFFDHFWFGFFVLFSASTIIFLMWSVRVFIQSLLEKDKTFVIYFVMLASLSGVVLSLLPAASIYYILKYKAGNEYLLPRKADQVVRGIDYIKKGRGYKDSNEILGKFLVDKDFRSNEYFVSLYSRKNCASTFYVHSDKKGEHNSGPYRGVITASGGFEIPFAVDTKIDECNEYVIVAARKADLECFDSRLGDSVSTFPDWYMYEKGVYFKMITYIE